MLQEGKNTCIFPMMFPKSFIVHKQVNYVSLATTHPASIFIRSKRVTWPLLRRKTETYIITKGVIPEKYFYIRVNWFIQIIWTAPTQDFFCTFSYNAFIPHICNFFCNTVIKNCFGVTEYPRPVVKNPSYHLVMHFYLFFKFSRVIIQCR